MVMWNQNLIFSFLFFRSFFWAFGAIWFSILFVFFVCISRDVMTEFTWQFIIPWPGCFIRNIFYLTSLAK